MKKVLHTQLATYIIAQPIIYYRKRKNWMMMKRAILIHNGDLPERPPDAK
jgi:hypothetical protein